MATIRARIDSELARRVGTWFSVREIQNKLRINPSTLKPLIMKYAREKVLKRRRITGTARSVEFTPNANTKTAFEKLVVQKTPYRTTTNRTATSRKRAAAKPSGAKKAAAQKRGRKTSSRGSRSSRRRAY